MTKKYCIYEKELVLAVYGELSNEESVRLENHIKTCDICRHLRKELEEFRAIGSPLEFTSQPDLGDMKESIISSIRKAESKPSEWKKLIAAGIGIALGIGIIVHNINITKYISPEQDIDQVSALDEGFLDSLDLLENMPVINDIDFLEEVEFLEVMDELSEPGQVTEST